MADKDKGNKYDYGFSEAFLAAFPELNRLVTKAADQNWSPERFQAAYRDTAFYKSKQESMRAFETQKRTDPATWQASVHARAEEIQQQAAGMGAGNLSWAQRKKLAEDSLKYGWNPQQQAAALVTYVSWGKGEKGLAYDLTASYSELARRNGVLVSEAWVQNQAKSVLGMNSTDEAVKTEIRKLAASAYPAFAEQLAAGQDLYDVASPYVQSMAAILEVNPEDIDLRDRTLSSALQAKDDKGRPAAKTLFDFERDLRKDPRWMQTKNARESLSGVARQVLSDFGLGT